MPVDCGSLRLLQVTPGCIKPRSGFCSVPTPALVTKGRVSRNRTFAHRINGPQQPLHVNGSIPGIQTALRHRHGLSSFTGNWMFSSQAPLGNTPRHIIDGRASVGERRTTRPFWLLPVSLYSSLSRWRSVCCRCSSGCCSQSPSSLHLDCPLPALP